MTRFRYSVAAGYRVIAPDLRGFSLTEAPRETKAYAIENYLADLAVAEVVPKEQWFSAPATPTQTPANDGRKL